MIFMEKGVRIFILTTFSINFRGAAELYCIQFTFLPSSWWISRKHEFKYKKKEKIKTEREERWPQESSLLLCMQKSNERTQECSKNKK